jgi:tetratricopeptide (TPR) repeat protein
MKSNVVSIKDIFKLFFSVVLFITVIQIGNFNIFGQTQENSISGFIFNTNRSPVIDINVELTDDINRTIARTRTDSSGRYFFSRLGFGSFRVKVLSSGTDFAEQIQQIDLTSFTGRSSDTQRAQLDIILKPRKDRVPEGKASSVFVQDVPQSAKDLYQSALSEFEKKNTDNGIKLLKEALTIFPDYVMALGKLGLEYTKQQQFGSAIQSLSKVVTINQNDFSNWYALAFCHLSTKKPMEAIVALEKATKLNPNSAEASLLYGIALRQTGKYKEAETQLLIAKKITESKSPDVHWHLALLYAYNLKKFSLAADELELYLKTQPDTKDAENIKKLIKQYRLKT